LVGSIEIDGAKIAVSASQIGAGIGAGGSISGISAVGNVTIRKSDVVTSASIGAAIGSAEAATGSSIVLHIDIEDSNISATAGTGAGIGTGQGNDGGISLVNVIRLAGGVYDLKSTSTGPGIGAGSAMTNGRSSLGLLLIVRGQFTVEGASAAGIGSGATYGNGAVSEVHAIHIINGNFDVKGSSGAGIGAGYSQRGTSVVRGINITGGMINASSPLYGAGIGAGYAAAAGESLVESLNITGGMIHARGSSEGAGIGGGSGNSRVESIRVGNGHINAHGGSNCAGIGTGVTSIVLTGGTFMVTGQIGIGATGTAETNVTLVSQSSETVELDCTARQGACVRAGRVIATNGKLLGVTTAVRYLDIGSGDFTGLDLSGRYREPAERDSFSGLPTLQFGSIRGLREATTLTFKQGSYTKTVPFDTSNVGVIVSLPGTGSVEVTVGSGEKLCIGDNCGPFSVGEYFQSVEVSGSGANLALILSLVGAVVIIAVVVVVCLVRHRQWKAHQAAKNAGFGEDLRPTEEVAAA
jgi:hypothetical protein